MLLSQFYSEFNSNYMRCDIVNISINNSDDFDLDEMSDKKILMNVTGSIDTIKKRFSRKKKRADFVHYISGAVQRLVVQRKTDSQKRHMSTSNCVYVYLYLYFVSGLVT